MAQARLVQAESSVSSRSLLDIVHHLLRAVFAWHNGTEGLLFLAPAARVRENFLTLYGNRCDFRRA
jgi:hypothetical protein